MRAGEDVIAFNHIRGCAPLKGHDCRKRNHFALVVLHKDLVKILRQHAVGAFALHTHLECAAQIVEIVDIKAAKCAAHGRIDICDINAHILAAVAVKIGVKLRRAGRKQILDCSDCRVLARAVRVCACRFLHKFVRGRFKILQGAGAAHLQIGLHAARCAHARNWRRRKAHDHGFRLHHGNSLHLLGQGVRGFALKRPLIPGNQGGKVCCVIAFYRAGCDVDAINVGKQPHRPVLQGIILYHVANDHGAVEGSSMPRM